jgi:uncharacterized membrane protein YfcA
MVYLLLFGLCAGILSGWLGIGGGIVIVPGLMLLFGLSQPEAQGTSLAVLIPPIGLLAAIAYYQHGFVRLPIVAWVAVGFAVGAFLGAQLVPYTPIAALRVAFGALLLFTGFFYVLAPQASQAGAALPSGAAAAATLLCARFLRRSAKLRPSRPAAAQHVEYHI